VSGRVFSVILLPTSECNVACDYCFEHKEPHRLSSILVPLLTRRLLDHLEHEDIEGMRNLLAGRRGDDHGTGVVRRGGQAHGQRSRRARAPLHALSSDQSHQLFVQCLSVVHIIGRRVSGNQEQNLVRQWRHLFGNPHEIVVEVQLL
jgi:hypothetical protein